MLRTDRPQVAVVGAGHWGQNLVRNFYRLGAVRLALDDNPVILGRTLEANPGIAAAASWAEVLNDPKVAGVALATPAVTHFPLAREALKAGKHVLVEKPLALSLAEGRELVELAASQELILMVDHLLQNHPAYRKLRELATSGALGRIRHIHSRRLSFGRLRTEEDVLWSFAPHDISMILGLMGRSPVQAAARGQGWISPGLADTAEVFLDFGGGATTGLSVSWINPVKEQKLVVVGEGKMAVFDDTKTWPEKLMLYPHRLDWAGQTPVAAPSQGEAVELAEAEPLRLQCQAFIEAMSGQTLPVTDGQEGLRVLEVLAAASESMRSGGGLIPVGGSKKYYSHPTAVIDGDVEIGDGCKIWHFSHLLSGSEIGPGCSLGQNVVVGPKVKIGRGVKIQNNVSVYEGVTLEDEVFCGPGMVFTNVFNPRSEMARKDEYRATLVKRGATIGANATVVCGHTLGAWGFIGAGAVVTEDVPDYALMYGNPARRHGWMCRCGLKLPEGPEPVCSGCGRAYREDKGALELVGEWQRVVRSDF